MKCPRCGSPVISEVGRDAVRTPVLTWQGDGWPDELGELYLDGGCYGRNEEYPLECDECFYAWHPTAPEKGEHMRSE